MVQENLHTISMHAKSHNTMSEIENLEETTNVTLLGVVIHNTNRFQPTFHIMIWWLKEGRAIILKLLLLVDKIGCFVLTIFAKIFFFVELQNWSRPFYLSMDSTWITITCRQIQDMIIIPVLISHFTMLLTKLIQEPICWMKWFNQGCYTTNRKTKECRPTQIDIEEKWQ